ncbi:MAG: hypothetical protein U5J95_11725 [Balneolaceae bacterium]|nr:hypothetical protein [Balneolaceae bacterium]
MIKRLYTYGLLLLLAFGGACSSSTDSGGGDNGGGGNVKPTIQSLSAPQYFHIGEAEKIVWEASDADNTTNYYLAINGDRRSVNAHDSTNYTAQQEGSIEVTLIADDADFDEDVTKTVTAQTRNHVKPEITQFDVPAQFDAGYAKKIIWNAKDEDNTSTYYLEINGDRQEVNAHDSTDYTPDTPGNLDVTFIAQDTDFSQDVTESATAQVKESPQVTLNVYNASDAQGADQRGRAADVNVLARTRTTSKQSSSTLDADENYPSTSRKVIPRDHSGRGRIHPAISRNQEPHTKHIRAPTERRS